MSNEPRIQELLDELLETKATPEEVCRSCVELLPEVRRRWQQLCRVQMELEALFPTVSDAPVADFSTDGIDLPRIAGYEMISVLGRGGMGVVFRARHLSLNRAVALKMALAGAYAGPLERERFQREAETVAALRHPNIVQIYEIGASDGRPYFTMELVEGGTLADRKSDKPRPVREVAALIATLARAVQSAHESGVLHRDLKPGNILLGVDGTPRISDFGLARRLDGAGHLTQSGALLGTPHYMAPEQARGKAAQVGPAADIYALGAILYELLTNRPPFEGETATETLFQVIHHDPLPPSKRSANVPRDLEIICLKCLRKEPSARYVTAAALAEDIECFLQGEAIAARPERTLERLARRIRQRPAFAATCAIVALLALALVGGGVWVSAEKAAAQRRQQAEEAALERAVEEDLQEMIRNLKTSTWPQAHRALERAKGRLGEHGSAGLRRADQRTRLTQGVRDLELASRLESVRLGRARRLGKRVALPLSEKEYEAAFREAGLGQVGEKSAAVAERVGASDICKALLAALDDWATCTSTPQRQRWVLDVAYEAGKYRNVFDPTKWRDRARNVAIRHDKAALVKLVADTPVSSVSVPLQLALAERLKACEIDPIPFLTRIQQAHPDDFWANLVLAEALSEKNDLREAIRYYQAAAAIRPDAAVVYDNLGLALALLGRMEEADQQFRKAAAIDPSAADAHRNLGIVRQDEAIDTTNPTQPFNDRVAALHTIFGDELRDKGKLVEATARYRQAIALDPRYALAQHGLRSILMRQGRLDEVCLAWRKAIDANPPDQQAWDGYAELCLFLGKEAEYRRVRGLLIERFHSATDPNISERTGRACLLLPTTAAEQRTAEALIDRALAAEPNHPYYQFAKGLADYRASRLESAITWMTGRAATVMRPSPGLVRAMAEHRLGKKTEARKTLTAAVLSFNWRPKPDHRDDWIAHALRREAESLLIPTLGAFLADKHKPRDNEERLALVVGCRYKNRPAMAARLYVDIFAADPAATNDPRNGHRFDAARAAALAGTGRGEDAPRLDSERIRWRLQAREWLRADLAAWDASLKSDAAAGAAMRDHLERWRREPDLAGLRNAPDLQQLPEAERAECHDLWKAVDVLFGRSR